MKNGIQETISLRVPLRISPRPSDQISKGDIQRKHSRAPEMETAGNYQTLSPNIHRKSNLRQRPCAHVGIHSTKDECRKRSQINQGKHITRHQRNISIPERHLLGHGWYLVGRILCINNGHQRRHNQKIHRSARKRRFRTYKINNLILRGVSP